MIAAQAEEAKKLQDNARVQTFVNSLEVILPWKLNAVPLHCSSLNSVKLISALHEPAK